MKSRASKSFSENVIRLQIAEEKSAVTAS